MIDEKILISKNYRKIEAMYHAGESADYISRSCGMPKIVVLDVMQLLYHKNKYKEMK